MELWIRSQNKGTLMKVEILGQTDGIIKAFFPNGNVGLGNYETVERALEVLDEIQNKLIDFKVEFNDSGVTYKDVSVLVYEMPEV